MAADLHPKQEPKSLLDTYAPYILITLIILLVLFIIAIILTVANVHAFQITGTEANLHQNLEAII